MSATLKRDQACALAKTNSKKALETARSIKEPWFRAQALSWVARFANGDPSAIAAQAAKAASECDDDYKRSTVRSWEIAALAEKGCKSRAKKSLEDALRLAGSVQPPASRCEALFSLLQAAFAIGDREAHAVYSELVESFPNPRHWRCKRAIRDAAKMVNGQLTPRGFFW